MNTWAVIGVACQVAGFVISVIGNKAGDHVMKLEIAKQVEEAVKNLAKK